MRRSVQRSLNSIIHGRLEFKINESIRITKETMQAQLRVSKFARQIKAKSDCYVIILKSFYFVILLGVVVTCLAFSRD